MFGFSNLNFKYKILIVGIITIFILTASIMLTMSNAINSLFTDIIYENQMANIKKTTDFFSYWIKERKKTLKLYAHNETLKSGSWQEKKQYLKNKLSPTQDKYYYFYIANQNGDFQTTFGKKQTGNIRDREYFSKIMEGKTVVSKPIISRATGLPIIVIGTPLKDDNKIVGMLGSIIRLNSIAEYINEFNIKFSGAVSLIINEKGKIIAHPQKELILNKNISDLIKGNTTKDNLETWTSQINNKQSGYFKCKITNSYIFFDKMPGPYNWKLINKIPQKYLEEPVNNINLKILSIGLIAIILSIFLVNYIAETISRPITKLSDKFKLGAQGDLSVRSDINTNDEIGEAAQSFNKMMEVINDLTYNDPLTGLPNIEFFKKRVNIYLNHLDNMEGDIYICGIGIDDFKSINDRFGHPIGDQILKKVADKLKNMLDDETNLSRMGDEFYFTLIQSNYPDKDLYNYCQEILTEINKNYQVNDNLIFITASMGIATYPEDGTTSNQLVKNASLAMHSIKEKTNKIIGYYSTNIAEDLSEKKELEQELSKALRKNQFILYYQPLISTNQNKIVGLEALIRWKHPEKGLVSPGVFIPLAEETGLIQEIGRWVIKEACDQLKELKQNYNLDNAFVSVNVSPAQFMQQDFIEQVKMILKKTGLDPQCLEIEITERTAMDNIKYTLAQLEELKNFGVKIAIDDFGTGYSSLSYLNQFALDTLKIDKSFIADYPDSIDSHAIVDSMITIGHNLNLTVVAEGVETKKQLNALKNHNCDYIQGYYFTRPLPPNKLIDEWLVN